MFDIVVAVESEQELFEKNLFRRIWIVDQALAEPFQQKDIKSTAAASQDEATL